MKFRSLLVVYFFSLSATAQFTQQLRGTVVEQVLNRPLAGATVTIEPLALSATTNEQGEFRFSNIAVGTYPVSISYTGQKTVHLDNVVINSGKETVLTIPMEAEIRSGLDVIIKAFSKKNKPLNDMSAVSARAFTVEETQKYAAAVNDPLRMAVAFPGVLAFDDGNNHIIIRGNSPAGLLWRMEGVDIPNPNHFSNAGGSGGGISILSSQLLSNSDFITSAFAAEYGNALSGVFDLKLRKGNNEKREYTLQAGVLGLNAAAEGPFSRSYKGSYLVNYRYSSLELLNKAGILSNTATTNFQDLSYHFYLPAGRFGEFTLFGFTGLSSEQSKSDRDSAKWENKSDRRITDYTGNTAMYGLTHTIPVGRKMKLKSSAGYSKTANGYHQDYIENDYTSRLEYKERYNTNKWIFNSSVDYKFSNRLNMRTGLIFNQIRFRFFNLSAAHENEPLEEKVNTYGNTSTQQAYMQWQYKPSGRLIFNAGLHYLRLALNGTSSLEPRASVRWNLSGNSSLSLGYGRHSQLQGLGVYFAQYIQNNAGIAYPNKDLGFSKSDHYVLSFSQKLSKNLLFKTEIYYQQLFDVPVNAKPGSTFSVLNIIDDYVLDSLQNTGRGRNYGIELSVERYLQNNFYLTLTNSVYQSRYTAADGMERNTRFNGKYISTLITGKDFVNTKKSRTFGINLKTIYAGGLRTTPIDLPASQQNGYTVFDEFHAYSLQNPAYFRSDLRVSMKWNRKKLTSTLSLDIQNLSNRLNISSQYFDNDENKIVTNYQTGLIPILNYKIEF